ncbi:hypothetical protein [Streptomyces sp. G45]|uniref:hypothetical protein n=1 Tax=Streptomyces sp. G45 TaxID=3406627 RepID=UPI003C24E597
MTADLAALEDRAQRAYDTLMAHLKVCPECGQSPSGCRTGAVLRRAVRDAQNAALRVRRASRSTEGGGDA